jgi:AmmeMemoRadiSam system protein B
MKMIREPIVSGLFYNNDSDALSKEIESYFLNKDLGPGKIPNLGARIHSKDYSKIYGAVVPHAGYMYSGAVASNSYFELVENGFPETFIILSPNHTGECSSNISIFNDGHWKTPLGNVNVDNDFANDLISNLSTAKSDFKGHLNEHGCEVHLPFLQYFSNDFKIVPIIISQQDMDTSQELADGIIKTINNLSRNVSIIASTDLTHYQPYDLASNQDLTILDLISKLDENELYNFVKKHNISMCGYGPTMTSIKACKQLGAKQFQVLKYATSGDISGDYNSVVGYGSGIFK